MLSELLNKTSSRAKALQSSTREGWGHALESDVDSSTTLALQEVKNKSEDKTASPLFVLQPCYQPVPSSSISPASLLQRVCASLRMQVQALQYKCKCLQLQKGIALLKNVVVAETELNLQPATITAGNTRIILSRVVAPEYVAASLEHVLVSLTSLCRQLAVDAPDRSVKCDLWAYIWGSSLLMAEILLGLDLFHGKSML